EQIIAWRKHIESAGGKECFFVAGKKLDPQRNGSVFHIHDRAAVEQETDFGNVFEHLGNGEGNFWYSICRKKLFRKECKTANAIRGGMHSCGASQSKGIFG